MNLPKIGDPIKFTSPLKIHWFNCVVEDQSLLEVGAEYTVGKIEVASSATYVWLQEFPANWESSAMPRPFFNLHSFKWND